MVTTGVGDSIGAILLDQGWVDQEALDAALEEIKAGAGDRLGQILIKNGSVKETDLARALAIQNDLEFVEGDALMGSPAATQLVSLDFAKQYHVLPLEVVDKTLIVVIDDPLNLGIVDDLRFSTNYKIQCKVSCTSHLLAAIERSYDEAATTMDNIMSDLDGEVEAVSVGGDDGGGEGDQAPVIRLVNAIITNAVTKGASDIHIEGMEKYVRIRYRIDGECIISETPPKRLQGALFGRLKMMAGMDLAERRKPQDGDIKIKVAGRSIDLRVNTLPSSFGESIVMRILDKESVLKGTLQLGFHPTDYNLFQTLMARPNGIILVTGPTGCGKTTTLYAALNDKNKPNVKIITAENPVEYNVSGINQVQVNYEIGLSFAMILKAMLRQAPNVILVGEVRDMETAEIAVQASLTGHLVLSTLHTNDAPSSVTRLIDMGIKPYLVSSSVIGILAQRLVRLICNQCKEPCEPDENKLIAAGVTREMAEGKTFYRGAGCERCNKTGYKGRIGIYELMVINRGLRQAIFINEPTHILREVAIKQGMHTLLMDGVRKVFAGMTTIEEVLSVAKAAE